MSRVRKILSVAPQHLEVEEFADGRSEPARDEPSIEVSRRRADGWELETYGPGETLQLGSIAFSLPVDAALFDRESG